MSNTDTLNYILDIDKKNNQEIRDKKNRKKEYNKKYYERLHGYKSKDDSNECHICGGYWKPDNRWRHLTTKKHQRAYVKYVSENIKY